MYRLHFHSTVRLSVLSLALMLGLPVRAATIDAARLREIPRRIQPFVEEKQISGAVTLVAHQGKIESLQAVGSASLEGGRRMKSDELFWIASMTKPMTAAAILMLQDEGKLAVTDPVEKYLPEFKTLRLTIAESSTNSPQGRPPRAVTLRDLLAHTSGLGDVRSPRWNASLAELVTAYAGEPLKFAPGSQWSYSNSGINTLGRIIEVVSGQPYATFMQTRIFQPLKMEQTTFWPNTNQVRRIAQSYESGTNKTLKPIAVSFLKGDISSRERTAFPAGGLYSTARDVFRFCQMALNGGTLDGARILSEAAVREMTRPQTGDLATGFVKGMSFGYGFAVVREPEGVTETLSAGSFGHGGAYGTQMWVDPQKQLVMVLMIQRAGLPNADASAMRRTLQEIATSAVKP